MVSKEPPKLWRNPNPPPGEISLLEGDPKDREKGIDLSGGLTVCAVTTSLLAKKKKTHTITINSQWRLTVLSIFTPPNFEDPQALCWQWEEPRCCFPVQWEADKKKTTQGIVLWCGLVWKWGCWRSPRNRDWAYSQEREDLSFWLCQSPATGVSSLGLKVKLKPKVSIWPVTTRVNKLETQLNLCAWWSERVVGIVAWKTALISCLKPAIL